MTGWGAGGVRTYNIKNGGRNGADQSRLDRVLEVVAEHRPDVLALQEFRGLRRDRGRLHSVGERLGMRPYLAQGAPDSRWRCWSVRLAGVSSAASVRRPFPRREAGGGQHRSGRADRHRHLDLRLSVSA